MMNNLLDSLLKSVGLTRKDYWGDFDFLKLSDKELFSDQNNEAYCSYNKDLLIEYKKEDNNE